jgi:hypothetical protein
MSMRTHSPARALVAAAVGLVVALGSTTVATAAPAGEPGFRMPLTPIAVPMAQKYYWDWSDSSDATSRTFKKSKYHTQAKLPHLVAWAEPAKPSHTVYLKFKQNGKWVLETKKQTNSKGEVVLELNPYCNNNTWCDGTWTYRLSIGDVYQTFKITYAEK